MKYFLLILCMIIGIILYIIISNNQVSKSTNNQQSLDLINVLSNTEEGFVDLTFSITDVIEIENGLDITAKGLYTENSEDKVLGFGVIITDKVTFYTLGDESNEFINTLNVLYGFDGKHILKKEKVSFDAVSLNQDSVNISTDHIKLKLFYDTNHTLNLYSESYLNFNLEKGILEFFEKDPDYRKNIIQSFSQN